MIAVSVLSRRLREGKTYEDFREAWLPEQERRHDRIDAMIEPGMTRHFYVQVAEDDFMDVAPPG